MAALANGVRVRTRGNWPMARREVRRTLPDECSGDTHHFFAADFFAFFGAGAAAAFFAIAESDGGDGGEEWLFAELDMNPGKCKENEFLKYT